jgi:glycosyltransferase involved in cell wall biosynthesis
VRTEDNPYKKPYPVPAPPDISVCVLTHFLATPYHRFRRNVVELCIDTMLAGVKGLNYELIIWDNGSTADFSEGLREHYKPHVMVMSPNIGVHSAQLSLAHIARGQILCYTDDDVFFYPGWFAQQKRILETYPNVGVVSGSPQRTAFRWGIESNKKWIASKPEGLTVKRGKLMPDNYDTDYAENLGINVQFQKERTAQDNDILLEYGGVSAWAHAHHMQYMGYREHILPVLKPSVYLIDNGHDFDGWIDDAGWLRLTTYERSCRHIGNEIDGSIMIDAKKAGVK